MKFVKPISATEIILDVFQRHYDSCGHTPEIVYISPQLNSAMERQFSSMPMLQHDIGKNLMFGFHIKVLEHLNGITAFTVEKENS